MKGRNLTLISLGPCKEQSTCCGRTKINSNFRENRKILSKQNVKLQTHSLTNEAEREMKSRYSLGRDVTILFNNMYPIRKNFPLHHPLQKPIYNTEILKFVIHIIILVTATKILFNLQFQDTFVLNLFFLLFLLSCSSNISICVISF